VSATANRLLVTVDAYGWPRYQADEYSYQCIHGTQSMYVCTKCLEQARADQREEDYQRVMAALTDVLERLTALLTDERR
jgi:hypothetical protein